MPAQAGVEKYPHADRLAEPLRLNLGGAGEGFLSGRIKGFKTVDLRPGPDTDIVSNVRNLAFADDNSVETIYASNVLEHFPHVETAEVLKEWHRVLRPAGKLYVSVPDFDACVALYNKMGMTDWLTYLIWGDQKHHLNFHYINFTFASLAKILNTVGFKDIKRVRTFPFGVEDASEHRDNQYGIRISLNVEAAK